MSQTILSHPGPEQVRTPSSSISQGPLAPFLNAAALVPLTHTGWLKITGSDRVRWLNGMVTNSIQDLAPGAGNYNFFLNAQGRIQGDGTVFAEPTHLLLETSAAQIPNLLTLLDRFIIMDDVELIEISRTGLLLAGPQAPGLLRTLNLLPPGHAPSLAHLNWQGQPITVIHAYSPLVPRFELWSDNTSTLDELQSAIPATLSTSEDLNELRILEGTPLFGTDIRDRDLPQETSAARALHFAKGCYLGQEIVERIRSRGNVHRTFQAFHLHRAHPSPGSALLVGLALLVDGKPVGELTSVSAHAPIGLGYIRREALALAKPIHFEGGTASPATLPLNPSQIL